MTAWFCWNLVGWCIYREGNMSELALKVEISNQWYVCRDICNRTSCLYQILYLGRECVWNSLISTPFCVYCGVCQGGVLYPLLFAIIVKKLSSLQRLLRTTPASIFRKYTWKLLQRRIVANHSAFCLVDLRWRHMLIRQAVAVKVSKLVCI